MSFHRFREKLARQQLAHDPRNRCHPGDEFFRVSAQQPIGRRPPSRSRSPARSNGSNTSVATQSTVSSEQLDSVSGRLCGDLSPFIAHGLSTKKMQKRAHRVCAVCGKPARHICAPCKDHKHKDGVPLHKPPTATGEPTCFHQHHNTLFHGLAKDDTGLTGTKLKDHCCPTQDTIAEHGNAIKRLWQQQQQP